MLLVFLRGAHRVQSSLKEFSGHSLARSCLPLAVTLKQLFSIKWKNIFVKKMNYSHSALSLLNYKVFELLMLRARINN